MVDLSGTVWRKSSRSSGNGQCVEVAYTGSYAAARDSKQPAGPALVFGADTLRVFLRQIGEQNPIDRSGGLHILEK
jgi:hypothetical protein